MFNIQLKLKLNESMQYKFNNTQNNPTEVQKKEAKMENFPQPRMEKCRWVRGYLMKQESGDGDKAKIDSHPHPSPRPHSTIELDPHPCLHRHWGWGIFSSNAGQGLNNSRPTIIPSETKPP